MRNEFINVALEEARDAFNNNEVPIGAVIVKDGRIIAKAHNKKLQSKNSLHHAEILAINEATEKLGDWRLTDCEMYVTLEPCPMCAGAISQSRIKRVYIGVESNIACNKRIISDILQHDDYYHKVDMVYLNNEKCSKILSDFFSSKR